MCDGERAEESANGQEEPRIRAVTTSENKTRGTEK